MQQKAKKQKKSGLNYTFSSVFLYFFATD